MEEAVICDGIRTPFGRLGGAPPAMRAGEAFAAQAIVMLRELGVPEDWAHGNATAVQPHLGIHWRERSPLILSAPQELERTGVRFAQCTMWTGVGQGTATTLERVPEEAA